MNDLRIVFIYAYVQELCESRDRVGVGALCLLRRSSAFGASRRSSSFLRNRRCDLEGMALRFGVAFVSRMGYS